MVGRGAQREGLVQAAKLLGIADRVSFTGFLEYEAMPACYQGADVFVLPALPTINLAEQFGFVVAEAMACGLPAVVSRVGGLPEVIGYRDELIFTPGDYRELSARLLAIYRDPDLRQSLSSYCLARARELYDARRNGQLLRQCLLELGNT